ncbi:MAG: SRPBCC family protein [Paracoccus sp. (in: a-proteobacteria)]|uniref:SRPBCC family protein n=1 Tax=Paracoccus sp. TaxID=267 RepID=UPI0032429588
MRKTQLVAATLGAVMAMTGIASAHGPSRLKTEQSVVLDATPAEVWEVIGHFDDMSWHPAVASTAMTPEGAAADVPDESTRVLTLAAEGDPTITEQLMAIDNDKMSYKYMITEVDTAVLPVTNYSSTLMVKDKDGQAEVTWKGGFYRGFPNNDPPAELNDDAAIAGVDGIYKAGLDALAERFGKAE